MSNKAKKKKINKKSRSEKRVKKDIMFSMRITHKTKKSMEKMIEDVFKNRKMKIEKSELILWALRHNADLMGVKWEE